MENDLKTEMRVSKYRTSHSTINKIWHYVLIVQQCIQWWEKISNHNENGQTNKIWWQSAQSMSTNVRLWCSLPSDKKCCITWESIHFNMLINRITNDNAIISMVGTENVLVVVMLIYNSLGIQQFVKFQRTLFITPRWWLQYTDHHYML